MHFNDREKTQLLDVAGALTDVARVETLRFFRGVGLDISSKNATGFDPVTKADRAAEQAMRKILAQNRPDDAILGEEFGHSPGSSGLTWVLDPIDGTRAYISGTPSWGVLIGLNTGDAPVLGIIDQPFTGERFVGGLGVAQWQRLGETRPLVVRNCASLEQATLFSTFPEIGSKAEKAGFTAVSKKCLLTRYGLDCYAYAMLAMGQIDLVIEAGLNSYDVQGPIAVVQAAGGIVTDWRGGPAHDGGRIIAAGDARTHAAALELLGDV